MADDEAQRDLAERVRHVLAGRDPREAAMFGGLSFMVDGAIAVAVRRGGALLVRVPPSERETLLQQPHVTPARMGERAMGERWLEVAPPGLQTDEQLRSWVDTGLRGAP